MLLSTAGSGNRTSWTLDSQKHQGIRQETYQHGGDTCFAIRLIRKLRMLRQGRGI